MINICFCLDNKLADKVYSVINSINDHTKSEINYYLLLAKEFDSAYVSKYKSKGFKVIENVEIPEIKNFNKSLVQSKAMFYRWLIADKIPEIEKVIYLDIDILLNTDIKNLWDIDLKDKVLGLVPCQLGQTIRQTIRYQGQINEIDMWGQYNCDIDKRSYLSGQMLIDLKKWREKELTEKLISFVVKYKTADMIALNCICQNFIMSLDYRWSAPASYLTENFKSHAPCINSNYSDAYLFHFHGLRKPWDKGFSNKKLKAMWEKYNEI